MIAPECYDAMGRLEIAWYMVRTRALNTVHQGSLNFPKKNTLRRYHPKKVGSAAVILVVMMVAIETMLVVMMMIMVMVLGTLTQVPFHHNLATLLHEENKKLEKFYRS
jgi:hypothetical protein